ncbi:MAG: prolyl-tRNA synthetase associated domain-containing protein [Alphaproteobacteria bacterium]|nr:prolyl-tRNA synthetase associated domain-containing protein [Alphaproteobacteria bacterium]
MHDEQSVLALLTELGIEHDTVRHAPVHTVAEAKAVRRAEEVGHVKNLFLRDRKRRMWLVTLLEDRVVDLGTLRATLGASSGFGFASHDRLREVLGIEPGSVTPLAAANDADGLVTVVLDAGLRELPEIHCHPLHNAATTRLSAAGLVRFLRHTGHEPVWLA